MVGENLCWEREDTRDNIIIERNYNGNIGRFVNKAGYATLSKVEGRRMRESELSWVRVCL